MESSPYDEEYKIDDGDETSQVDLYTPSPRGEAKKVCANKTHFYTLNLNKVNFLAEILRFLVALLTHVRLNGN